MKNTVKHKNSLIGFSTLILLTLSFIACNKTTESDYEKQVKLDDQKINKYLTDSSIQAKKNAYGFYYQVLKSNDAGKLLSQNDVVDFYYKVTLLDGTFLEDSVSADAPARFKLLSNTISPMALDLGISLMKVGEKYRFFIPSNLAYGNYKSSWFPANSIFVIDVRVANAQSEADINITQRDSTNRFVIAKFPKYQQFGSGLCFIDSIPGAGDKPLDGNLVTINYARNYLDGSSNMAIAGISFHLGFGQAPLGIEEGIKQMRPGGKAILILPSSIAYGQSQCVLPQKIRKGLVDDQILSFDILPYSILEYFVELKSVN